MAVYTHISEKELVQYLTLFNIGALVSFSGITDGVENTNYRIVTTHGTFILTLFEKRTRREDLPFILSFMTHLHGNGISCPDVILSKAGERITDFRDKPAIIITFLEGKWLPYTVVSHAAAIGALLARMHIAGGSFKPRRENSMSLPAWKSLISNCGMRPDEIEAGLTGLLKKELGFLEAGCPQDLPSGAVHADLFPDNVFFTGENVSGVIDFYFSCTDTFVYDLMLTINAWCFDTAGNPDAGKSAALLEAYQRERPLSPAEKKSLPFFGRAAALRIIATRLYDWLHPVPGAVIKMKDPLEYVRILKYWQAANEFPA